MAVSDLLKTVRYGGPQARAAATSLLDSARAGGLRPSEAAEVKQLLAEPALQDVFRDGLGSSLKDALTGGGAPVRDVKALLPNAKSLDAKALAQRFSADLTLLKPQLDDPRLGKDENAERLMEFFGAYAEQFVQLAHPPADLPVAPMRQEDQARQLKQFEKALTDGGFKELHDRATGRDGVAVGKALLDSKSVDELKEKQRGLALEGAVKKDPNNPNAATAIAVSAAHERLIKHQRDEELEQAHRKGRKGKLGGNMVWNALHLLREGANTEDEKEALKKLVLTAGLLFLFVAVALTVFLLTI
jgi:hypothetical protein